jgi:hypothetical protein
LTWVDVIFGTHTILAADLATMDDYGHQERDAERARLMRTVADLERRQASVLRQAQNGDADDPFAYALRGTYNELDAQRTAALRAVTALDAQDQTTPAKPGEAEVALLDALPYLAANLADAPSALLRTLFEVTRPWRQDGRRWRSRVDQRSLAGGSDHRDRHGRGHDRGHGR